MLTDAAQIATEARAAENIYAKATKAELAQNYDEAFKLYVQATESFLHLSRSLPSSPSTQPTPSSPIPSPKRLKHADSENLDLLRTKWKANAAKAIERAEKIKVFAQKTTQTTSQVAKDVAPTTLRTSSGSTSGIVAQVRLTPIGINHFSTQEQFFVLKRGSRINGLNFPFWSDDFSPSSLSSASQFSDPDGQPPLSTDQQRVSAIWLRPSQIARPSTCDTHFSSSERMILPQDILQHIVTDCSVCASISVCLEHARRFGTMAVASENGIASALSLATNLRMRENGRYDMKVFVNGAWRRIVIDDALPYNPSDGSLMCMTIHSKDDKPVVYWPSLIEKSYMKLMGGYDFPGSNSSIDLHALTGWIPEQIDIKCLSFERERTWERLITGFTEGKCLVTLGTGARPNIRWRETPLLSAHSYAVIDIDENEDDRTFTVLDSWVRPDDDQRSRVLQIPWSEVVYVFDGIYLSWDPSMWKHHIDFHGMWKRGSGTESEADANHNLRITFVNANSQRDEEIWILLTRHLYSTKRTTDFICLRAELENPALLSPPLTKKVNHQQQQHEISRNSGTYTNSSHFLVRTRIPVLMRSGAVGVTASYEGEKEAREIGFTVSVFSSADVEVGWDESISPPPYSTRVERMLTNKNSGGNCTHPTFMVNPQYHLHIHPSTTGSVIGGGGSSTTKKSRTKVVLRSPKDVPVNVVVVWSKGERKDELLEQEVAATSGAYTYGLAQIIKDLLPGDYTVITSPFEPSHTGLFTLKVECSTPFDLKSIPQEGAGMYTKTIRSAWDADSSAGAPQFNKYEMNPRFELVAPASVQIKIRLQVLQHAKVGATAALNVALFHFASVSTLRSAGGGGTMNVSPLATSGGYSETLAGAVTPLLTLAKGRYVIIPSTHMPGVQAEFGLIVYTSLSSIVVKRIQ